jgi:hypothetical protein
MQQDDELDALNKKRKAEKAPSRLCHADPCQFP